MEMNVSMSSDFVLCKYGDLLAFNYGNVCVCARGLFISFVNVNGGDNKSLRKNEKEKTITTTK